MVRRDTIRGTSRRRFLRSVGVTAGIGATGTGMGAAKPGENRGNGKKRGHEKKSGTGPKFPGNHDKNVVGYYTSWSRYARGYMPADVPLGDLSHVLYAFLNVESDGTVVWGDSWADSQNLPVFQERKSEFPETNVILSIGGWTFSGNFSDAALTEENRQRFARTAIEKMRRYDLDGLDIDWEYPGGGGQPGNTVREGDPHRFTLLLEEVRNQLDEAGEEDGKEYELSFAASADPDKIDRLEHEAYEPYVDDVHVMAYDFHGSWSPETGFNAPLYADPDDPTAGAGTLNADFAMQYWADTAIPREKLNQGIPTYGKAFSNVPDENDGLYQSLSGTPDGTWGGNGNLDFWDVRENYETDDSYEYHWHEDAKVPWLYSAEDEVFVTYDDPRSVRHKAEYVDDEDFGGVMFWELNGDRNGTLIDAMHAGLRNGEGHFKNEGEGHGKGHGD